MKWAKMNFLSQLIQSRLLFKVNAKVLNRFLYAFVVEAIVFQLLFQCLVFHTLKLAQAFTLINLNLAVFNHIPIIGKLRYSRMKWLFFSLFLLYNNLNAQLIDSLNTAKNCSYMKTDEKEMIYEINRVRSNPKSYLQYIEPLLTRTKATMKKYGKGEKNYSITRTTFGSGDTKTTKEDTVWHYRTEEEVKALTSLINDLKKLKPLSVLQPDSGIYNAARKHAADNDAHQWQLWHTGSDGSMPWDRIRKFSPSMENGNENLAGQYPEPTARDIMLILLIDSGIPGYGHRYNLLNSKWTHAACVSAGLKEGIYQWIQNFGQKRL